jgi:hypothetical protein
MENVLAPVKATDVRNVTASGVGASRLHVEEFSGWRRQWLRGLTAVQILCENLLLVDGAIAARKMVQRYKLKPQGRANG